MGRTPGPARLRDYAKELAAYLESKAWGKVQHNARLRAKNRCELCGAASDVRVWLKEPTSVGTDNADDAIVLCTDKCFGAYLQADKEGRKLLLDPPVKPKRKYTRRATQPN